MKSSLRIAMIAALATLVLSFVSLAPAQADTNLTAEQQQEIKTNCNQIKNTLQQLHVSDALLRVNRGQFYESMSSKLMVHFNARLSNNSVDNGAFVSVTNDYNTALNSFRIDYQSYEQKLSDALGIDCTTQPANFHKAIGDARSQRNKVHDDVVKLNQLISNYQTAVTSLANSYASTSGVQQ